VWIQRSFATAAPHPVITSDAKQSLRPPLKEIVSPLGHASLAVTGVWARRFSRENSEALGLIRSLK